VFELRRRSYDHPDARVLTERAQAYYVSIYGGRDDDPLIAGALAPPGGGFVVGYLDGAPVAMGGWLLTDSELGDRELGDRELGDRELGDRELGDRELGDRVAQIRRMFVDQAVRRRGLARAVLQHLESDAVRHGATMIILATGRPQVEAIAFYRRHGYTDVPPFGFYAGADQVLCLGKDLGLDRVQPTS
jgi:GNAT superfamily N-acetyltransferase